MQICKFSTAANRRCLKKYQKNTDKSLQDLGTLTAQRLKFHIKDSFSKRDQILSFLRIWSHLLKKSSMQNFIFYTVIGSYNTCKFKKIAGRPDPFTQGDTPSSRSILYRILEWMLRGNNLIWPLFSNKTARENPNLESQ